MKDKIFELITKYAVLLSTFYILSFAFTRTLGELELSDEARDNAIIQLAAPLILSFVLNLITAYMVVQDSKKHNVKTSYVALATILYRPLGAFAFLLFFFVQDKYKGDDQQNKD